MAQNDKNISTWFQDKKKLKVIETNLPIHKTDPNTATQDKKVSPLCGS
jgi:hypothetical protein